MARISRSTERPPTPESKIPIGPWFTRERLAGAVPSPSRYKVSAGSGGFQSLAKHAFAGTGGNALVARLLRMFRPWLWGVILGLCVGGGVVLLSSLRYGFSAPLLLLGIVLAIGFGGLALVGAFVGRRTLD